MAAVYKGSLNLNKVVGVRKDNPYEYTMVKLKPKGGLQESKKSMKTSANVTSDGYKK